MPILSDRFGRAIGYIRVSVTDRCNLRCRYCRTGSGAEGLAPRADILTFEEIIFILETARDEFGIKNIRLTGGEPLVRRGITDIVRRLVAGGFTTGMTTNGTLLEQAAADLKSAGLKRLNISMDTLSADIYRAITGGDISLVMAGIEAARRAGFKEITVNAVARPGGESGSENFLSWAAERNLDVKFIEEMPLGKLYSAKKGMAISACGTDILTTAEGAAPSENDFNFAGFERKIVESLGLTEIHGDGFGPGRYYSKRVGGNKIGFVAALSKPFCEKCNRFRLTSDGKLLPCLGHPEFADLRQLLRSKKSTDEKRIAVTESFIYVADIKPRDHDDFAMAGAVKMSSIGG